MQKSKQSIVHIRSHVQSRLGDTSMRLCARDALRRRLLSAESRAYYCCLQLWHPITRYIVLDYCPLDQHVITEMLCLLALRLLSVKFRAYCCCLQFWLPIACVVPDYCPLDQHMHYGALNILKTCSPGAHYCARSVNPNRILDVWPWCDNAVSNVISINAVFTLESPQK